MKQSDFTRLHFVGIGGIGMSGLAQMANHLGIKVTGSDRGYGKPENERIFAPLERQGIQIFPQDGSFANIRPIPDAIVYSSAIEKDNPDFIAAGSISRLHRSEALVWLSSRASYRHSVAVTGSCGKSSVTAYLTETLLNLGEDPGMLNGAVSKSFVAPDAIGNFRPGDGSIFVFEADESDKSLVNYTPDYAIILNIGTDHYPKAELIEVFAEFLAKVKIGAILHAEVYSLLRDKLPKKLKIRIFACSPNELPEAIPGAALSFYRKEKLTDSVYVNNHNSPLSPDGDRARSENIGANNYLGILGFRQEDFRFEREFFAAGFSDGAKLILPKNGIHNALNALAIWEFLQLTGKFAKAQAMKALAEFAGVWRRNDYAGISANGALVYDDYAHNPEKIASAITGMQELAGDSGRILAVFQVHGYGPFEFMRGELFRVLEKCLRSDDLFIFLPPYYAGGTSSFSPTAEEVVDEYRSRTQKTKRYRVFSNREELSLFLQKNSRPGDVILIMGARDNSLSDYARSLTIAFE